MRHQSLLDNSSSKSFEKPFVGPFDRPFDRLKAISTLFSSAGGLEQEKGTIDLSNSTLFASKWLPERNDFRRGLQMPVITFNFGHFSEVKKARFEIIKKPEKKKHIIHKAVRWKTMLEDGSVNSMSEIARNEGLTRARVTQIMNLLKLPAEMQVFLLKLEDAKQVREYSERKLRDHHGQDQFH